jgi:hypothetical protein
MFQNGIFEGKAWNTVEDLLLNGPQKQIAG